jgi:hypothetical protein
MKIDVVHPNNNFRGMSYSDWVIVWNKWLMSEDPNTYDGGDILFLRGNVDYRPLRGVNGAPRHIDPQALYDRTGEQGETVFQGTAVFIPIITTIMILGYRDNGVKISNEENLRYAANREISEGGAMWATVLSKGMRKPSKIVNDLKDYRIESPLFKLTISKKSLLKDKTEQPLNVGTYDVISAGYFLIIRSLKPSIYRIFFGGKGRGEYFTNAVYDITVKGKKKDSVLDKSGYKFFIQKWNR